MFLNPEASLFIERFGEQRRVSLKHVVNRENGEFIHVVLVQPDNSNPTLVGVQASILRAAIKELQDFGDALDAIGRG